MLEPYQDRNPHSFGKKSVLYGQTYEEIFLEQILNFSWSYFLFSPLKLFFFRTNMKSTFAVTLHLKDLSGAKLLVFKIWVHLFVKNLQLLIRYFWWMYSFSFFLNILTKCKTKCNSVQERAFFTLSCTLLHCHFVFKILKTSHSSKVIIWDSLPTNAYSNWTYMF